MLIRLLASSRVTDRAALEGFIDSRGPTTIPDGDDNKAARVM